MTVEQNEHIFLNPVDNACTSKQYFGSHRNVKAYTAGEQFNWCRRSIDNIHQLSTTLYELEEQNWFFIYGVPRLHKNNLDVINRRKQPKRVDEYSALYDYEWVMSRVKTALTNENVLQSYDLKGRDKWMLEVLKNDKDKDLTKLTDDERQAWRNALGWTLVDYEYPSIVHDRKARVLAIDLDGIKSRSLTYSVGTDEAVSEVIQHFLPAEFHNVSCHYQWSSGAGINGKANLHLWFMTDEYHWVSNLYKHFKQLKNNGSCIDEKIFQTQQPMFFTPPVFHQCKDPIKKRSGFIEHKSDVVALRIQYTGECNDWWTWQKKCSETGKPRMFAKDHAFEVQTFNFANMVNWSFKGSIDKLDKTRMFDENKDEILRTKHRRKADYRSITGDSKNRGAFLFKISCELIRRGERLDKTLEFIESLVEEDMSKDAYRTVLGAATELREESKQYHMDKDSKAANARANIGILKWGL